MGKFSQRTLNKQMGTSKFTVHAKCCGLSTMSRIITQSIPVPSETDPTPEPLRLVWDDIANVPVATAGDFNDWNTFFDLPANGMPFDGCSVSGNEVQLYGGSGITILAGLFSNNPNLISITDDALCIVEVQTLGLIRCTLLETIELNACVTFGDNSCSENPALATFSADLGVNFGTNCFDNNVSIALISLPSAEVIGDKCFGGCKPALITVTLPVCTNLGSTVGNDLVFNGSEMIGATAVLTIPVALMTVNAGNPDGDIQAVQAGGGTIVTV